MNARFSLQTPSKKSKCIKKYLKGWICIQLLGGCSKVAPQFVHNGTL